jgi:single-strand DNA-binding protein
MNTRVITGHLAADPEIVSAGSIQITKLRVIENTGEYRKGAWTQHDNPTTHYVEAKFQLGENSAITLHKGDAVIVVGREHTNSWEDNGSTRYARVLEADNIGPDLNRAVASVKRTARVDDDD